MRARLIPLLLSSGLVVIGLVINFDSILLNPSGRLPGTPNEGAYSLLHVWWPVMSVPQPDDLTIHSFIGAPYLTNHTRYTPVLQSVLFHLLNWLGPVLAFNIILIFSQIATQLVLSWFFIRKQVPWTWALLASFAFVLSPWYSTVIGQADLIAAGWWVPPLALIGWDRWTERPTMGRAIAVVIVLYAAVLCGVQNILWLVALWLPYALWSGRALWPRASDDAQTRDSVRDQLAVMVLAFLVLFLFYPAPGLVRALQGNEPAYGPVLGAPEVRSFIGWILRVSPAVFAATLLTGFFGRSSRAGILWLIVAAFNLLVGFALIPDALNMVAGALGLPYWPLADRSFSFGIALFAMLAYVCQMWAETWQGQPALKWWAVGLVSLAIIPATSTATIRSVPTHDIAVPDFYREIATEPEDYILLEYPFGLVSVADGRSLGDAAYLARYSVWDLKRPASGLAPYYEPYVFQQVQANQFLFPDTLTTDDLNATAQQLGQAVREWRIGYVVVHPELLTAETLTTLNSLAEQSASLCPPVEQAGLILYRARWHPYGCVAH